MTFIPKYTTQFTRKHLLFILLIISISISLLGIVSQSGRVMEWPMDQSFVTRADLRMYRQASGWVFQYPRLVWSGGVTSSLVIGIYKLAISPSTETLNWHAKGLATTFFLASTYGLCLVYVKEMVYRILAFLVIATSALQFAEPSSDIFAASFFALFLISVRMRWPRFISAGILIFFGLSKIQLVACSAGIFIAWYYWDLKRNGKKWEIPVYTIIWLSVLLAPGFKLYGIDMIQTNKGLRTFASSYMTLFSGHQFSDYTASKPTVKWPEVMQTIFPGSTNVTSIILNYPKKYLEFVFVSAVTSLSTVIGTVGFMFLPFIQAVSSNAFPTFTRLTLRFFWIAVFLTLLPPLLLRFISARYLAITFLPLIVLTAAACSEAEAPKKLQFTFIFCSLISLIINFALFLPRLVESPYMLNG